MALHDKAWAQLAAVPTHAIAVLPDEVTFAQAAALPVAGITALLALDIGGNPIARRVLVTGASGGVGRFAVQLAHIGGAHVTAVSASPERARGLTDLGADEVIHELTPEGPEFDVIVEGVGGPSLGAAIQRVAADGTVISFASSDPSAPRRVPDARALRPRPRRPHLRPARLPRARQAPRRDRDARPPARARRRRPPRPAHRPRGQLARGRRRHPRPPRAPHRRQGRPPRRLTPPRVALVTGANRGIGLEVCRQLAQRGYAVLLGARDAGRGARARRASVGGGHHARSQLDVADAESVRAAGARGIDRLDVLVNNAAILYDTWQRGVDADLDQVREAFETNLLGAWRVTQAVLPLLRASPAGAHRQRLQRRRRAARTWAAGRPPTAPRRPRSTR